MTAAKPIQLYDLCGAEEDRRFSPYCWRIRMALAHKGLPVETVPWHFTEKEKIAFSGQGLVPVIVDEGKVLHDSWTIALHLEERYRDRPTLFGGPAAIALSRFYYFWSAGTLVLPLFRIFATDIVDKLRPVDAEYFRRTREQRFGRTLEQLVENREQQVEAFRQTLQPLRLTLKEQPFLGGESPLFADYMVFGFFQWARCVSPVRLLDEDDPVHAWRARLLGAFGGLAGKAVGYPP